MRKLILGFAVICLISCGTAHTVDVPSTTATFSASLSNVSSGANVGASEFTVTMPTTPGLTFECQAPGGQETNLQLDDGQIEIVSLSFPGDFSESASYLLEDSSTGSVISLNFSSLTQSTTAIWFAHSGSIQIVPDPNNKGAATITLANLAMEPEGSESVGTFTLDGTLTVKNYIAPKTPPALSAACSLGL